MRPQLNEPRKRLTRIFAGHNVHPDLAEQSAVVVYGPIGVVDSQHVALPREGAGVQLDRSVFGVNLGGEKLSPRVQAVRPSPYLTATSICRANASPSPSSAIPRIAR